MTTTKSRARTRLATVAPDLVISSPSVADGADHADLPAISRKRAAGRTAGGGGPSKFNLTDREIDGVLHFAEGRTIWLHDQGGTSSVAGLRMRIGPRSAAWVFVRDRIDKGNRRAIYQTLGKYDRGTRTDPPIRADWHMNTQAARDAALKIAGLAVTITEYRPATSRDPNRTFAKAFDRYLVHLRAKAESKGKPPRWAERVDRLGNSLLLPQFAKWSMKELSERRADHGDGRDSVEGWYRRVSRGRPTSANHALKVLRAIYLREAKRDDALTGDPTKLPSAAITMRAEAWQSEKVAKAAMRPRDFPAWLEKWRTLPPTRRAYHLTGLLMGARPGELARTPWGNLDLKSRTLTISESKAGHDIPIPLSAAICRAIKIARDEQRASGKAAKLIFPGCDQAGHHEPAFTTKERGHSHRRTWKTIATDLKISNENSALVLGHVPEGMSAKYAVRQMLLEGRALRGYQRQVSRAMIGYLGTDPTLPV
jgi:hypothetical protein